MKTLTAFLLLLAAHDATAALSTPWVTSMVTGPLRNDYTGSVGACFTVGANALTVTGLERFGPHASSPHTLTLWLNQPGNTVVATAVTAAAQNPGLSWVSVSLTTLVSLAANTPYCLTSSETAGGDGWYDWTTSVVTTADAVSNGAVYQSPGSGPNFIPHTGDMYGPVSFDYVAQGAPSTASTLTWHGSSGATAPWPYGWGVVQLDPATLLLFRGTTPGVACSLTLKLVNPVSGLLLVSQQALTQPNLSLLGGAGVGDLTVAGDTCSWGGWAVVTVQDWAGQAVLARVPFVNGTFVW